jgi:hypothetical protein
MMIRYILAFLTAAALAAMPVAAWAASAPCPMSSSGQMATMDQATAAPASQSDGHTSGKSCTNICAAMATSAVIASVAISIPAPVVTDTRAFALPLATLVASQPERLDPPPRLIV